MQYFAYFIFILCILQSHTLHTSFTYFVYYFSHITLCTCLTWWEDKRGSCPLLAAVPDASWGTVAAAQTELLETPEAWLTRELMGHPFNVPKVTLWWRTCIIPRMRVSLRGLALAPAENISEIIYIHPAWRTPKSGLLMLFPVGIGDTCDLRTCTGLMMKSRTTCVIQGSQSGMLCINYSIVFTFMHLLAAFIQNNSHLANANPKVGPVSPERLAQGHSSVNTIKEVGTHSEVKTRMELVMMQYYLFHRQLKIFVCHICQFLLLRLLAKLPLLCSSD